MRPRSAIRRIILISLPIAALWSCGGSGGGGTAPATPPPPQQYSVGGTVSGLASGASLTLSNNGSDTLTVHTNGAFQFGAMLPSGANYSIAVVNVPSGQRCGMLNATGTVAGSITNVRVACATPAVQLWAGALGGYGNTNGAGAAVRFYYPTDVGYDAAGNLYVADLYNRTVRKVSPTGVVTTLAGVPGQDGTSDGQGAAARFNSPGSLAVDPSGVVYVADWGANTIRRIDTSGTVSTIAGTPFLGGTQDGTGAAARFQNPGTLRLDASGVLYLNDNNSIRSITPQGVVQTAYSGMTALAGLALDGNGNAYLSDGSTNEIDIVHLATGTLTPLATGVSFPGWLALAPASSPTPGVVYVGGGAFYSDIRSVAPGGSVSSFAGVATVSGNVDGKGPAALLWLVNGMVAESTGNVLFADSGNNAIRQVTADATVSTRVGLGAHAGNVNGAGLTARFDGPNALATDDSGNLYLSDTGGLRKISAQGVVSAVFAGGAQIPGLAVSPAGDVAYFSQPPANTIYKVSGSGPPTVFAAGLNYPWGIGMDSQGNLYVAGRGDFTISRIASTGALATIAGMAGVQGASDGVGTAALFWSPIAVAIDTDGTVYVVDGNAVRKISVNGAVTTIAGSAQTQGFKDGAGSAALFNSPSAIAIGPAGLLFVSDSGNNAVRQVTSAGVVTTIAGIHGSAGVHPGPLPASLNLPSGLVYIWPTLYVVDAVENSVLAISGIF